jgi:DNA-directed RNA polymerase specialized sigma24 family protein
MPGGSRFIRDRQRAEVVLLAADGWPGTQIAPRVGMSQQSVCKWVYDAKKAA